mmetsp:Transcript_30336/g.69924  ORF Transcript_30336/g.69924 Transcript_30336/m.69924 type:complete len:133 (+) Transcript_30336:55-453(+)
MCARKPERNIVPFTVSSRVQQQEASSSPTVVEQDPTFLTDDDTASRDPRFDLVEARNSILEKIQTTLLESDLLANKEDEKVRSIIAAVNGFVESQKEAPLPTWRSQRLEIWNDHDAIKCYKRRKPRQESGSN